MATRTYKCTGCGKEGIVEPDEELPLQCPHCNAAFNGVEWLPEEID